MRRFSVTFLFAGIIISHGATAACVVTDDAGHNIHLSQPARRLIVLAPDLVENIFAIDAGSHVVGVVKGSDYPAAARRITQVGSYSGIDLERIVTLHPDLIVAWKSAFPRQLSALQQLGFPVYVAAPKKLEDVPRLMRKLGCLTAKEHAAEVAANQFEQEMKQLHMQYADQKPVKVFFQIDRSALITVNKDSWINQVLALCGGQNIYANARTITPEVSRESVLVENPDAILNDALNDDWKKNWQSWPDMSAVRGHRLFTVDPDLIARAGPRLVKGAKQVCDYLSSARTA